MQPRKNFSRSNRTNRRISGSVKKPSEKIVLMETEETSVELDGRALVANAPGRMKLVWLPIPCEDAFLETIGGLGDWAAEVLKNPNHELFEEVISRG